MPLLSVRRAVAFTPWAALAAFVLVTGCSNPSITLTPTKSKLCAGGFDSTEITAKVLLTGGSPKAGVTVNFNLTGDGSFSNDPAYALQNATVASDAKGEATVTLYSGSQAGNGATVTANFSDGDTGESASATITIPFTEPGAGCGGAPTSTSLTFRCDVMNIAALREPQPDIAVPCTVEAATHDGSHVPAEAMDIQWLLEAGSMEPQTGASGHRTFLYHPGGGTRTAPKDVEPDATLDEPSRFDALGQTRNPRKGLVTLVAVARGEEAWIDTNGNGKFDPGIDTFDDLGEPFVDMNDNGERDPDEEFIDLNGNGQWDGPNGKWDADTQIWAVTHILWTGPPAIDQKTTENAATHYTLSANTATITAPASLTVSLYLRDENLNPVAGFDGLGSYDQVAFNTVDSGIIGINPATRPIRNQLGFTINADGTIEGRSFLKDPAFQFVISTYDGYDGAFTVTFQTTLSPGPAGEAYFLEQIIEDLTLQLQGHVVLPAPPPP
ncbi:MAG TPA: hypothetical protein VGQ83_04905 [Polyangia bacterium]|jgi:hypothetical protein